MSTNVDNRLKAEAVEIKSSKPAAEKKTQVKLPKDVFAVKVNTQAIFDVIMSERASRRQGTHKVKHRGEVRGGGKKPFAQKHTGRARAGSTRSPIWVGGGTVFGPTTERNYNLKVNKKVRKLAMASILTLKAKEDAIIVHAFTTKEPSTKNLLAAIKDLKLKDEFKKLLIVTENDVVFKSGKNLQNVVVQKVSGLSVEQIANADAMIITHEDLHTLEGMVK